MAVVIGRGRGSWTVQPSVSKLGEREVAERGAVVDGETIVKQTETGTLLFVAILSQSCTPSPDIKHKVEKKKNKYVNESGVGCLPNVTNANV